MSQSESVTAGGHEEGPHFVSLGDGLEGTISETGLKLVVFEDSKQIALHLSPDETHRLGALLGQRETELSRETATTDIAEFKGTAAPGQHISIVDRRLGQGSEIPVNESVMQRLAQPPRASEIS